MVNQLEMLYEGKAKKIYATDKEDMVIVHYKEYSLNSLFE